MEGVAMELTWIVLGRHGWSRARWKGVLSSAGLVCLANTPIKNEKDLSNRTHCRSDASRSTS